MPADSQISGNLITNPGGPPPPTSASAAGVAFKVIHTGRNPQSRYSIFGRAIAIGTGTFAGYVWKKTTTVTNATDWVQVFP